MLENMNLRKNFIYYYDFYISAKEKSFAKAEKENFLSSGTLARNVHILEEIEGVKLINTSNHGFELTLNGKRLYEELDSFFVKSGIFKKLSNISENLDITLTIGSTRNIADFALPKYLIKFSKVFPNVKINIFTDSASNLNNYLINHKIDVLFDYLPNLNFSESQDFKIQPLMNYKTCFACSKEYYEEIKEKVKTLNDLKNYKLIIPGASRRRQMLDEELQINNLTLEPILQMPDSKLMADMVKSGKYIGYFIEEELAEYNLIKIELEDKMPINFIGIIYPNNTINNIAKEFVNIVLEK